MPITFNDQPILGSFTFQTTSGKIYILHYQQVNGLYQIFIDGLRLPIGAGWNIPPDYEAAKELLEAHVKQ